MTPQTRSPQQRDRRFARVRRMTQTVVISASTVSAILIGVVAVNAKPATSVVTTPTAPVTATTTPAAPAATHTVAAPKAAPVTTTTVCTTSPSGTVTCY